jgi:hypothetical protein
MNFANFMTKNKHILSLTILIALIAFLHIFAMKFNLYFAIWWFDLAMHFLGGLWCGLFVVYCFAEHQKRLGKSLKVSDVFLAGIVGAIVIGSAWEVYEYVFGLTYTSKSSYRLDTILDMCMDVLGGLVAAFSLKRLYSKS